MYSKTVPTFTCIFNVYTNASPDRHAFKTNLLTIYS